MKIIHSLIVLLLISAPVFARDIHVAKNGRDSNPGTKVKPYLTIQRAADMAQAGDVITVHEGLYREEITPPRGGLSDDKRIVYRAAKGEKVEIRGSEVVKGWRRDKGQVWKIRVSNKIFGEFNPFAKVLTGPWFNPKGKSTAVLKDGEALDVKTDGVRKHHHGCVYLDGEWAYEAARKEDLYIKGAQYGKYRMDKAFFAEVSKRDTIIYANFGGKDPNKGLTEVNVRETIFYPRQPFCNYITVSGFIMRHAAPGWAPPSLEQPALIGVNWSKGWIIENNIISHSINTGITLGKYGDERDRVEASNRNYLDAIDRAMVEGNWNKENVGSHIVRNNEISYCEQAGIVGSMGCAYSEVRGNHIHHIHTQRRFSGAEMAGIKFHGPIDVVIADNYIHDAFIGVWLDWMSQGSRVTSNLFHDNDCHNQYYEVNHGPYIVDNNISFNGNYRHLSQGGAFAHNYFDHHWGNWDNDRVTPYFEPHSTKKIEDHDMYVGDDRFYNNVFVGRGKDDSLTVVESKKVTRYYSYGLRCYEKRPLLPEAASNVYYYGSEPCKNEKTAVIIEENPKYKLIKEGNEVFVEFTVDQKQAKTKGKLVTTELLGIAKVPQQKFTNPDGSPLTIDRDYFGKKRDANAPTPGPFADVKQGRHKLKLWPKSIVYDTHLSTQGRRGK